jgi:hypothetical protein
MKRGACLPKVAATGSSIRLLGRLQYSSGRYDLKLSLHPINKYSPTSVCSQQDLMRRMLLIQVKLTAPDTASHSVTSQETFNADT